MWSMTKRLGSTVTASIVGSVIGSNVNTTTRVLQKRTKQGSILADAQSLQPRAFTKTTCFLSNGRKNANAGLYLSAKHIPA